MQPAPATDLDDRLIPLHGGFACRTSVVLWLIEASWRLDFCVVGEQLDVSPREAITLDDDMFIRAHRDELLACVRYYEAMAEVPA